MVDGARPDFEQLASMAEQYGITLEGLGPQFEQGHLEDRAQQLFDDFDALTRAGGDVGGVLAGMSDEISNLVQDSLKFGTAIPDNMRPLIEELARSGQLLDENGVAITDIAGLEFEDTPLAEGLSTLNDTILALIDTLAGVPDAIDDINNAQVDPIHVPIIYDMGTTYTGEGPPPGTINPKTGLPFSMGGIVPSYYAQGGDVVAFTPRGTDTVPAMLTPGEEVLSTTESKTYRSQPGNSEMLAELRLIRAGLGLLPGDIERGQKMAALIGNA
jgi:hypothetical protein